MPAAQAPRRGVAYETKRAAINASSDNAVKAAPVAWINAR